MHAARTVLLAAALLSLGAPQDIPFEVPIQLIGFPVIILAVRLSNFIKKLSYAVNPNTYRSNSRSRRGLEGVPLSSVDEIEKKLVLEMGDNVCVYEDICTLYARRINKDKNSVLDWQDIFRRYEESPRGKEQFLLLSVFMGDLLKSEDLCHQLAKRGRSCTGQVRVPAHPYRAHLPSVSA